MKTWISWEGHYSAYHSKDDLSKFIPKQLTSHLEVLWWFSCFSLYIPRSISRLPVLHSFIALTVQPHWLHVYPWSVLWPHVPSFSSMNIPCCLATRPLHMLSPLSGKLETPVPSSLAPCLSSRSKLSPASSETTSLIFYPVQVPLSHPLLAPSIAPSGHLAHW